MYIRAPDIEKYREHIGNPAGQPQIRGDLDHRGRQTAERLVAGNIVGKESQAGPQPTCQAEGPVGPQPGVAAALQPQGRIIIPGVPALRRDLHGFAANQGPPPKRSALDEGPPPEVPEGPTQSGIHIDRRLAGILRGIRSREYSNRTRIRTPAPRRARPGKASRTRPEAISAPCNYACRHPISCQNGRWSPDNQGLLVRRSRKDHRRDMIGFIRKPP